MSNVYKIGQPDPIKRDYIRVKSMGIIRRGDELLLEDIRNPDGTLIGFRPLGGSIEFGEKSWEALEREFMEELGEDIKITKLFSVLENIFTWAGTPCHEIVFLYEADLLNKGTYNENIIERMDISNDGQIKTAVWRNPFDLPNGLPLFPNGLTEKLKGE